MHNINSLLGQKDLVKKMLKRRFPNLKEKEFQVQEDDKKCHSCGKTNLKTYKIKIEGTDEWRKVPESKNEICIQCEDKKLAKEAYRTHLKNKYKYLWEVTSELKGATLSDFKTTCIDTTEAMDTATTYIDDFKDGDQYNLLWVGSYGVGKSHLSKAIADDLQGEGYTVAFISVDNLLDMIKSTFNDKRARSEYEIKKDLESVDVLVLDELGTDDQKTDWAKGTINEIVNSRNGKSTIYTTNLNISELEKTLDGRTVDRLHQNTKIVEIFTESYRRKQTR